MRLLVRLQHLADAETVEAKVGDFDVPVLARDRVGRVLCPDLLHRFDGFQHHFGARLSISQSQQLEVAAEAARADAEQVAPARQMIELRHLGGDHGRMRLRQVQNHPSQT